MLEMLQAPCKKRKGNERMNNGGAGADADTFGLLRQRKRCSIRVWLGTCANQAQSSGEAYKSVNQNR
jgi:hypothetical protein